MSTGRTWPKTDDELSGENQRGVLEAKGQNDPQGKADTQMPGLNQKVRLTGRNRPKNQQYKEVAGTHESRTQGQLHLRGNATKPAFPTDLRTWLHIRHVDQRAA